MIQIDEFWRQLFPVFLNDYEFIYMFLDIGTIITMFKLMLYLPMTLMFGSKGGMKL